MATVPCGSSIFNPEYEYDPGTIGCLVRFTDKPERVLLMTAGHAVLGRDTGQGNPVKSPNMPDRPLGLLLTWTSLSGDITADVALAWVDPLLVTPGIMGIGAPKGVASVSVAQHLRIFSSSGAPRDMRVDQLSINVPLLARLPDGWNGPLTYYGQITCNPGAPQMKSAQPGDSGAIVVDDNNRVIGMVVGISNGSTVVTPIAAILSHPAWGGGTLEVLDSIPQNAIAPPIAQQALIAQQARGASPPGRVNLSSLGADQKVMAQKILNAFYAAGFGLYQQVAALANAMAESSLNPKKVNQNSREDSVGLFQLNRMGGRGADFSVAQLQDPDFNIKATIDAISRYPSFEAADSLDSAVGEFVRRFEQPKDEVAAIAERQQIARSFYVGA